VQKIIWGLAEMLFMVKAYHVHNHIRFIKFD
jgi:hypothetical protein